MSNSKHHHSSHHESKGVKAARNILAFFLFLCISLLSVAACVKAVFISTDSIVSVFTNDRYISGLCDDIKQYSYDLCDEHSIPKDCIDECVTYNCVYTIENAYICGLLSVSDEFTETTYSDKIDELGEALEGSLNKSLKEQSISAYNKSESVKRFVSQICDYTTSKVEFALADKLDTICTLGNTICTVLIAALAVIVVVLGLIVYSIGNRKFRSLRAICYSVLAAMWLNLFSVAGVQIIKSVKTLVIYPKYLCESAMRYVNSCQTSVAVSAIVLLVLSFVIMTFVWKLKRNEK